MPKMELKIGSRSYEISCNDGEESTVRKLAERLNSRMKLVAGGIGNTSESTLLAITALTMEDEISSLREGNITGKVKTSDMLEIFVKRVEGLANSLEKV